MREHLQVAFERSGKLPARLAEARELPDGLDLLWDDFLELHGSRGSTMAGPARISFMDIDAWQRVNRVTLRPWQIEAIRRADTEFMASLPKPKETGQ